MTNSGSVQHQRRYDLDWLRIVAFGLLILYHIGMFYVPWPWHVKSEHAPVDSLQIPMRLMNSWRLPLLFFVSGVAVRFAIDKKPHTSFIANRFVRLFVPLLFGMLVVCAPQTYYELVQSNQFNGSVWEFYRGYAAMPWASPEGWSMITPTWNHLWYLLYVLVYTLFLALLSFLSGRRSEQIMDSVISWALQYSTISLCVVLPTVFVFMRYILSSSYDAQQTLWGDWHNLSVSFFIMLLGYATAKHIRFWAYIKNGRWFFLAAALLISASIVLNIEKDIFNTPTEAIVRVLHCWAVIYTLLGFGQTLLNNNSAVLRYLTGAIFPYYILHQTLIIVFGVALNGLGLSLPIQMTLLCVSTLLGCAILYHFVMSKMGKWGILLGTTSASWR